MDFFSPDHFINVPFLIIIDTLRGQTTRSLLSFHNMGLTVASVTTLAASLSMPKSTGAGVNNLGLLQDQTVLNKPVHRLSYYHEERVRILLYMYMHI